MVSADDEETPRAEAAYDWFYLDRDDNDVGSKREQKAAEHHDGCGRGNRPAMCLDCYGMYRAGFLDWRGAWLRPLW